MERRNRRIDPYMLAYLFPWMPVEHEAEALRIYDAIFGNLPLDDWTRQGTIKPPYYREWDAELLA